MILSKMKRLYFCIILILLFTASCKPGKNSRPSEGIPKQTIEETRPGRTKLKVGTKIIWVEVVADPQSREKGLMFRESLPRDEGMLFVFETPDYQSFWMKNTYLPLDIAFIDPDLHITDIFHMVPMNDSILYKSTAKVTYALETNRDWFEQNGIQTGDKIEF
jgi:hypothetical protein